MTLQKNISILFQSEIDEPFESKLGWNVPWMVLYKMVNFCVDRKSKMTTIA
jgi:hypothetical protein